MPVLPFIDLLILLGTGCLGLGFTIKLVNLAARLNVTLFGISPMDCLLAGAAFFMLAVALSARTWVKGREPAIVRAQRGEGAHMGQFAASERPTARAAEPAPANGGELAQPAGREAAARR